MGIYLTYKCGHRRKADVGKEQREWAEKFAKKNECRQCRVKRIDRIRKSR